MAKTINIDDFKSKRKAKAEKNLEERRKEAKIFVKEWLKKLRAPENEEAFRLYIAKCRREGFKLIK